MNPFPSSPLDTISRSIHPRPHPPWLVYVVITRFRCTPVHPDNGYPTWARQKTVGACERHWFSAFNEVRGSQGIEEVAFHWLFHLAKRWIEKRTKGGRERGEENGRKETRGKRTPTFRYVFETIEANRDHSDWKRDFSLPRPQILTNNVSQKFPRQSLSCFARGAWLLFNKQIARLCGGKKRKKERKK